MSHYRIHSEVPVRFSIYSGSLGFPKGGLIQINLFFLLSPSSLLLTTLSPGSSPLAFPARGSLVCCLCLLTALSYWLCCSPDFKPSAWFLHSLALAFVHPQISTGLPMPTDLGIAEFQLLPQFLTLRLSLDPESYNICWHCLSCASSPYTLPGSPSGLNFSDKFFSFQSHWLLWHYSPNHGAIVGFPWLFQVDAFEAI